MSTLGLDLEEVSTLNPTIFGTAAMRVADWGRKFHCYCSGMQETVRHPNSKHSCNLAYVQILHHISSIDPSDADFGAIRSSFQQTLWTGCRAGSFPTAFRSSFSSGKWHIFILSGEQQSSTFSSTLPVMLAPPSGHHSLVMPQLPRLVNLHLMGRSRSMLMGSMDVARVSYDLSRWRDGIDQSAVARLLFRISIDCSRREKRLVLICFGYSYTLL